MDKFFVDTKLIMKDAGLVGASAAAQVSGAAKILSVGNAVLPTMIQVDVTAIEIASNDELYRIKVQGSSTADFSANYEDLAILELGAKEVLGGDVDSSVGRYIMLFTNTRLNVIYPYLRVYTEVSGAVATGINYSAILGK